MSDARREELLRIILEHSFRTGEFTLASGEKSNFYLDLRTTLMRPRGAQLAGELVFDRLARGAAVESVGGMVVGAVPLVSAVLLAAAAQDPGTPLLGFFVRKEKKGHGEGKQVEGAFEPGQTVALLEDTVTSSGSTLKAVDAVEAAGGKVARVLCVINRGGRTPVEKFAERGLELESLFDRSDLPV